MIARAGGLKPTAYAPGARIVRREIGNVAIDLVQALAKPGSDQDILLQEGDVIIVPEQQFTVKVVGEVGFSTSLVYEDGKKIDWYVDRAGGYLENADKKRTRVVHPNGLSFANKGGHKVLPGSTIVVPGRAAAGGTEHAGNSEGHRGDSRQPGHGMAGGGSGDELRSGTRMERVLWTS